MTRMSQFGEWVTEAQFTGQDVIVYTAHGWLWYKQSGMGGKPMKAAFYLANPNGYHFNPVVGMKPEGAAQTEKE